MDILEAIEQETAPKSKYRPQVYNDLGQLSMHDGVFEAWLFRLGGDYSLMNRPVFEREQILKGLESGKIISR
jgi:hypothetical protein